MDKSRTGGEIGGTSERGEIETDEIGNVGLSRC